MYKKYVDVVTYINHEGKIVPMYLVWGDKKYSIDKIINIRKATSQVGGWGILFECKIAGQTRKLFWEENRWFLESHRP